MSTAIITTRKAESTWKGDVNGGHGLLSLESGSLNESRFSLRTRVGDDVQQQTNPEELIAGAVSSCFSMALSKVLTDNETVASLLDVSASVDLEVSDGGISLTKLTLNAEGIVPALDESGFIEAVETTAKICPILQTVKLGFNDVVVNARLRN